MFGLMRTSNCGMTGAERDFRRLNYCGTCKTTGALYGQKARFLLDHDAVFLAEILTALSDENVKDWGASYHSYNCLNLPPDETPLSLQFAATTNVILTEFKLADHLADEGKRRYKLARQAFSGEFCKAENRLRDWNFPFPETRAILQSQTERENEIKGKTAAEILANLAAPTADVTAIFFAEGARLVGKNDAINAARELGSQFGKLIYLLDAFEDYERDFRAGQFNAIRAAFDLKENVISAAAKRKIVSILRGLETETARKIHALPIPENQKTLFAARLSENLLRKLKTDLPVVQTKKVCHPKPKRVFSAKWRAAFEKARVLAGGFSWQAPLVFLFIFAFALAAPARAGEAKSARECFDLSFNLMFLGAIFGAVLSAPMLALKNLTPDQIAREIEKEENRRRGDGWCSWCDGCDCCCCACEEGCCCCDGCDCCSCDS